MDSPYDALSLATFNVWKRYFRFETQGFETLRDTETSLIVAYHGGPWTFDLWLLGDRMHDELGYFPRAVWHWLWWALPGFNQAVTGLGGLRGAPSQDEIAALKARGEHLIVAPGGMREAMRPCWDGGRVDLGERRGYLRLALEHDLPIIPVVATGLDATFVGLNDGYRTSRRVFGRGDLPAWLAFGIGGIWPLALPFPAKIRQRIGAPIRLGSLPASDAAGRAPGAASDASARSPGAATRAAGRGPGAASDAAGRAPGAASDAAGRAPGAACDAAASNAAADRLERAHELVTTTLQAMLDDLRDDVRR